MDTGHCLGFSTVHRVLDFETLLMLFFIENPQTGLLKKQPFIKGIPFCDVDYCQYGKPYRKRTRIWTNKDVRLRLCPGPGKCKSMVGSKHMLNIGNGTHEYTPYMPSVDDKHTVPTKLLMHLFGIRARGR